MDRTLSVRGIEEGLPSFIDELRAHNIPFDLFISGEVADVMPPGLVNANTAVGCHGLTHPVGPSGYMNQQTLDAQRNEILGATSLVRKATGRFPVHFRAPNFSADEKTISVLESTGYRLDSSVLPGRYVKRWRIFPLVDHRGAPLFPYYPDRRRLTRPGGSAVLEVPVTPNPIFPGGPLGLGFLNAVTAEVGIRGVLALQSVYLILLAHSWEMVDWGPADPVAGWVRTAASSRFARVRQFLEYFSDSVFVNMDRILAHDVERRNRIKREGSVEPT